MSATSESIAPPPAGAPPKRKKRNHDMSAADAIHEPLIQALAIIELVWTLTTVNDCAEEHLEVLGIDHLCNAMHCAMLRVREALVAVKRIGVRS